METKFDKSVKDATEKGLITILKVDVCPMCGSKSNKILSKPPYEEAPTFATEVHSCDECPCVWFEFHNFHDIVNLAESLGYVIEL